MDENSKLILFTIMGSLNLKTAVFEGVYLSPVSSEASGGRILNTYQLHNYEQLMNINQQLFLLRDKLHFF